jgi:nicotinamidase/pyrazinamidase
MEKFGDDTALLLIDIQNDFCAGGALAVPQAEEIVPVVNELIPWFRHVLATQDWHPADHSSFRPQGGPWPVHCVQGTRGAELHPRLDVPRITGYFRKATTKDSDSYSGFAGVDANGRGLDEVLRSRRIRTLYVAGLATDYCVRATVLDALKLGYRVYAVVDAMRAVGLNPGDGETVLNEMRQAGAKLVVSQDVLR